jgi:hypothetical protein
MVKSVIGLGADIVLLRLGNLWETARTLVGSPWRITVAIAALGFLVAWRLSVRADRGMSDIFSGFWYRQQPALRAALKGARRGPTAR